LCIWEKICEAEIPPIGHFILSCGSCVECRRRKSTVCLDQKQPGFTQWGSFAEYVAVPRAELNIHVLPKNSKLSFVEAAALGCRFTTAYRAIVQQGLKLERFDSITPQKNKTLAVFGCGGLGLSCVMIAKAVGHFQQIISVDISKPALEKALNLGATDVVLQVANSSGDNLCESVRSLTPNQSGADLSIDAAGFKLSSENAVKCTRRGGRMVQVGLPQSVNIPMVQVAGQELEIVGSHGLASSDMKHIADLVETGQLDPKQLIERMVPLEVGIQALMDMDQISPLGMTMITSFSENENEHINPSSRL